MKDKHFFASANTSIGFSNFFNYINYEENSFTYIIKGSSGSGKSTLMRKIANYFAEKGIDIEYFYCSSDPTSLDAIRLINYNVSIVDGTAPHIMDTKMPEVFDKIINLGEFISSEIFTYKEKIVDILNKKSSNYSLIYNYLEIIGKIDNINRTRHLNYSNNLLENKIKSSFSNTFKNGTLRKLFIDAVDSFGLNDIASKNDFNVNVLPINKYQFGYLINNVTNEILQKGANLTIFYDVFSPTFAKAILINDKLYFTYDKNSTLNNFEIENNDLINKLLLKIGNLINDTRKLHFDLEKYYSNYINFDKLNSVFSSTILDIEKRI